MTNKITQGLELSKQSWSALLGNRQLVIYPLSASRLARVAADTGLVLQGPHRAFLIQGDDELGALVGYHQRLCDAGINVVHATGVADGRGGYGYLLQVKAEDFAEAERVLRG